MSVESMIPLVIDYYNKHGLKVLLKAIDNNIVNHL